MVSRGLTIIPVRRFAPRAIVLFAALALACGRDVTEPSSPGSLTLNLTVTTLALTSHVQLTATAKASDNSTIPGAAIIWSSDDPAVSVSTQGVVTGVSVGVAHVTATIGSIGASARVVVLDAAPGGVAVVPTTPWIVSR